MSGRMFPHFAFDVSVHCRNSNLPSLVQFLQSLHSLNDRVWLKHPLVQATQRLHSKAPWTGSNSTFLSFKQNKYYYFQLFFFWDSGYIYMRNVICLLNSNNSISQERQRKLMTETCVISLLILTDYGYNLSYVV